MSKLLEMYLNEAILTGDGSIQPDDDYPVGNIVWGEKMVPELIPSISGNMKRYKSDPDFTWSDFEASRGMDDKKNYHTSLLGLEKLVKRDDWSLDKYIGKRSKDDRAIMKARNKIDAKEPIGKEPVAFLEPKADKDGNMKTKIKQTKDTTKGMKAGDVRSYKDIEATSIDKEISGHVASAQVKESIEDRIVEYVNEADLTNQEEKDILLSITNGEGLRLHLKQINVDLIAKKVPDGIQFEYKDHMDLTVELVQLCDKHRFKFRIKNAGRNTTFTVIK